VRDEQRACHAVGKIMESRSRALFVRNRRARIYFYAACAVERAEAPANDNVV
jgi:hypothetical protein